MENLNNIDVLYKGNIKVILIFLTHTHMTIKDSTMYTKLKTKISKYVVQHIDLEDMAHL